MSHFYNGYELVISSWDDAESAALRFAKDWFDMAHY